MVKILTFDIEEWFHILDNESTKSREQWSNYESRIHENMDTIFKFLDETNLQATFFIVGWIAEKYPEVVKRINNQGFEIGSHTHYHQLMYDQSRHQVKEDLTKSIDVLESLTGKKVRCFRAPGFSIKQQNKWALEVLVENGITHDSSIFPASRSHGGFPELKNSKPFTIEVSGFKLKEFPINTIKVLHKNWIYSGGGYFRIFPYNLIRYWSNKSDYIMTYFHPRDFDPDQPVLEELSTIRKFKTYVGLKDCMAKLEKWSSEFNFIDLATADKLIDWDSTETIYLNSI